MKKKKFLTILLSGVIGISLLSGCGSKPTLKDAKNYTELCQAQAEATKKSLGIRANGTIYTLKDNSNNSAIFNMLVSKPDTKKKKTEDTETLTKPNIYLEYQPTQSLSSDGAVVIRSFIEQGDKIYTSVSGDILSAMFSGSSSNISEDSNGVQVKKATLFNNSNNISTSNNDSDTQLNISELSQNPEKLYDAITAGQIWLSISSDDIQTLTDEDESSQKKVEFMQKQLSDFTPEELAPYISGFENTGEYTYQFHFNMKNFVDDLSNNIESTSSETSTEETTEQSSVSNSILNTENSEEITEITTETMNDEDSTIEDTSIESPEEIEELSSEDSYNEEVSDDSIVDEDESDWMPADGAKDIIDYDYDNDDNYDYEYENEYETTALDEIDNDGLENVTDIFVTVSASDAGIEKIKIDTDLNNNEQITGNFTISYSKEGLAEKPDMPNIIKLSDVISIFKSIFSE